MRQIKFRAWNGERMLFNGEGGYCDFEIHGGAIFEYSSSGYECLEKNYPLMQFTGMQDKNGVDIYEGDIVKVISVPSAKGLEVSDNLCVEWRDGKGCFSYVSASRQSAFCLETFIVEVIGNIHQNSELLGVDS